MFKGLRNVLPASRRQNRTRLVRSNFPHPSPVIAPFALPAGCQQYVGKISSRSVLPASRRQNRTRLVRSNFPHPSPVIAPFALPAGCQQHVGKIIFRSVLPASRRQNRTRLVRSNFPSPFARYFSVRSAGRMPAARSNGLACSGLKISTRRAKGISIPSRSKASLMRLRKSRATSK